MAWQRTTTPRRTTVIGLKFLMEFRFPQHEELLRPWHARNPYMSPHIQYSRSGAPNRQENGLENAEFGTERRTHRSLVNLCLSVLFLFALSRRLPFDEFQLSPAAVYLNQRINRFENVLQTMSGTPNSGAPLASGTNSNS